MKIKEISYNQQTGLSKVEFVNRHGNYTGYAQLNNTSDAPPSRYIGCHLAEGRAWLVYLKNERRRQKAKMDAIKSLKKDLLANNIPIDEKILKKIQIHEYFYKKEINRLKEEINAVKDWLKNYLTVRDKILKRTKAKKEND